jgi:glucuronokinase
METEKWIYLLVTTLSVDPTDAFHSLPPALYPIGGVPVIDTWLQKLAKESISISDLYLITTQQNHSKFTEWGQSRSLPYQNILISTATDEISSLRFMIREHEEIINKKNILLIKADSLVDCGFSLNPFICQNSVGIFASFCGVVSETLETKISVNDENLLLVDTSPHEVYNRHLAAVYSIPSSCYEALKCLPDLISTGPDLLKYLSQEVGIIYQTTTTPIIHYYPMNSLPNYTHATAYLENYYRETFSHLPGYVNIICPARAGLMGNPSDGFHGKTLSFIVNNFYAQVTVTANPTLAVHLIPHPVFDITQFESFDTLHKETQLNVLCSHPFLLSSLLSL